MTSVVKPNTPVRPLIQFSHLTSEFLYLSDVTQSSQTRAAMIPPGENSSWLSWKVKMTQPPLDELVFDRYDSPIIYLSHVQLRNMRNQGKGWTLPPNKAWLALTVGWKSLVKELVIFKLILVSEREKMVKTCT